MTSKTKPVNIDPFDTVAGTITVKGEQHGVLHLNGADFRRLNGGGDALTAYGIAERIVPSLAEKVWDLSSPQVMAIIAIADGRIAEVEQQFPNGTGPETTEPNGSPSPA